jgi:hypothetical protein
MAGFLDLTGLSHFKTKLLEAVNATFLTQKDASATYLGINAKAKSAAKADSAGSATKATLDGNGANIAATYLPLSGGTLTGGVGQTIVNIAQTSGDVSLAANRCHKMTISGATTFQLPVGNLGVFTQIKVMVKVDGTPSINWGTDRFFNKAVPRIESGWYDFYFDHDPVANAWVAGAVPKGGA